MKINRLSALISLLIIISGTAFAFSRVTYPVTVKDEWGHRLSVKKQPQRIISCMPSITEMLFALNLDDEVAGVTTNCNYPKAAEGKEKVGREVMNVEKIMALKPDLVVMLGSAQKNDIGILKKRKLPVYVIDPHSVNGIMVSLQKLGVANNRQNSAYKTIQWMKRKLEWVNAEIHKSKRKAPSAAVIVGYNPLVVAGPNSFIGDVLKKAGCRNIVYSSVAYPPYSFEELIRRKPDVLVIPKGVVKGEKAIYNDSRWNKLSAVKNYRVLFIDADIISRPGPRVVTAIEKIANFAYKLE